MGRHFALTVLRIIFSLAENSLSSMSTEWMATDYATLTTKYPEYRNRWISDGKWIEIIRNNYITNPSKEKEEELKFNRGNMVRAIGSRWKTTLQDFTPTNQSGIFRHQYSVTFEVDNDKGGTVSRRRRVTYLYATKPGQDYPRKPRVAEVFKDEDETDDRVRGLKKREVSAKGQDPTFVHTMHSSTQNKTSTTATTRQSTTMIWLYFPVQSSTKKLSKW